MKTKRNKEGFFICLITGFITAFIIWLFLLGKIIDIPYGTHKGGVIAATGVIIIIIIITGITYLIRYIIKKYKNK